MDGPKDYYIKLNKSDRVRQIPHNFTSMWNLTKQKKGINKIKQIQTHKYKEKSNGHQKGRGGVRKLKKKTTW